MNPLTDQTFEQQSSRCKSWLARQVKLLPSVIKGYVYVQHQSRSGTQSPIIHASWPLESRDQGHFHQVCNRAEKEKKGVILTFKESDNDKHQGRNCVHIAFPLALKNDAVLVAAFELYPEDKPQLHRVMQQLEWGLSWLKEELTTEPSKEVSKPNTPPSLYQLQKGVEEHSLLEDAAQQLANELQTLFICLRASIGLIHPDQVKILAISHQSTIEKTSPIVADISRAMEECYDQRSQVIFPASTTAPGPVTIQHARLSTNHGSPVIVSFPIIGNSDTESFILLLERQTPETFSAGELQLLQNISSTIGPVLSNKFTRNQSLLSIARNRLRNQLRNFSSHGKAAPFKAITLLLFLLFIFFAKGAFRVETDVTLSGTILRGIVAPFPGYVAEAKKSAGDHVEEGEILALLDTSDLTLDELTWRSKYSQADLEYRKAIADNATSHAKIISQQKKQAEIQLSLLHLKIERAEIKAPFTGRIVTGDLSQSIGGPVEKGKLLFEIVPDGGFKVLAQVDEKDISFIEIGQEGTMVFNSLPKDTFNFTVSKITPIATAENGSTSFRVEAGLQETEKRLSPGMTGYGKITVGKKPLLWLWTRTLRNKIQLLVWKLRP